MNAIIHIHNDETIQRHLQPYIHRVLEIKWNIYQHHWAPSLPYKYIHHSFEDNISWQRMQVRLGCSLENMAGEIWHASRCVKLGKYNIYIVVGVWINLPLLNELHNSRMLVNPAVVHHNYGVGSWPGLHMVKKARDEFIEKLRVEWAFDNITM